MGFEPNQTDTRHENIIVNIWKAVKADLHYVVLYSETCSNLVLKQQLQAKAGAQNNKKNST